MVTAGSRRPLRGALLAAAVAGAACSDSGDSSSAPIQIGPVAPELLACRSRVDDPLRFAEIALRTVQNLGTERVADRSGIERGARLHSDGRRVVFARERDANSPASREIFVAWLDGSAAEERLTQNTVRDDEPVWSPDGARVLFRSDRNGQTGLWTAPAGGGDAVPFLPVPPGFADGEPDWSPATNRVVWSRRGPDGSHRLWIADGSGFGATQLTDGVPAGGAGNGDRAPAFAPNGATVAFVRRIGASNAALCLVEVVSGTVVVRLPPAGDIGWPRFAPTMDRIFFGLAEPAAGRAGMRLAVVPLASGAPLLLWPDRRWQLEGLDVLPIVAAAPAARAPQSLDVQRAQVQVAFASSATGTNSRLVAADGSELILTTATSGGREVAGINCRFDLPVVEATDVLELHLRAVARATRIGGDAALRISIYNPVEQRFDTAVEIAPASTGPQELQVSTSSLRHVTRQRQLRFTVIADLPPGDRAELRVDLVGVELVARERP